MGNTFVNTGFRTICFDRNHIGIIRSDSLSLQLLKHLFLTFILVFFNQADLFESQISVVYNVEQFYRGVKRYRHTDSLIGSKRLDFKN